ncbi:hypothetical protein [Phormidium tenue]|jgi:hypothetical protein|uniref:Uncharacterized protein n=1 Tax=Phormidium tenue FACHB-1050 TaxID=2692857 RepID=A0ABR8CBE9_9CYAN|nr:hypothetical protein [Phormidium tenue]MBD2317495.1 hypothetical protein [Phormidium tenue FACHB-1050]
MGTTIWVLSKGKTTETDDWDHSALFYAVEKLDLVCDQIGLTKISEFLDWTDFEANMFEEDDFPDEEVLRDKASWFNPSAALPMLRAVREYVASNESERESLLEQGKEYLSEDLLEDLDDCIAKVEKIETEGDLFHFCVVM